MWHVAPNSNLNFLERKDNLNFFLHSLKKNIKNSKENNKINEINKINQNYFRNENTFNEEKLNKDEIAMVINKPIDWSSYIQKPASLISTKNLSEIFHGILHYMYFISDNKLNIAELSFHYHKFEGGGNSKVTHNMEVLKIFNYKDVYSRFHTLRIRNAYFGFTFKRIKVNPICYSIRSDVLQNNSTHLKSYVFEAFDETKSQWDVLDERANSNDLIPSGSCQLYFVYSTKKYYSSFRIRQTEEGHNDTWGFSLAGLDIHGKVLEIDPIRNINEEKNSNNSVSLEFDPFNEDFGD